MKHRLTRRDFLKKSGLTLTGAAVSYAVLNRWPRPQWAHAFPPDAFWDSYAEQRMSFHENPMGPHPSVFEVIEKSIRDQDLGVHRYPDEKDLADLKRAILKYNHLEDALTTENVVVSVGSSEALDMVADAYHSPSVPLLTEWPTYRIFLQRAEQNGARVFRVLLNDKWKPDYEEMLLQLESHPEIGVVHFNAINNPVGTFMEKEPFDYFARRVWDNFPHVKILVDSSDPEFMDPQFKDQFIDVAQYVKEGKNIIWIQTFSHIFGITGLRLGYAIAPAEIITDLEGKKIRQGVSRLSCLAGLASLENAPEQIQRSYMSNMVGREYFYSEFKKMGLEYLPSQGAYALVNCRTNGDIVFLLLVLNRIWIRWGSEWDMTNWIRVNPGLHPRENKTFLRKFKTVLSNPLLKMDLAEFLNTPEGIEATRRACRFGIHPSAFLPQGTTQQELIDFYQKIVAP